MKFIFTDLNLDVVSAWREQFKGTPYVSVQHGSIFDVG